MALIDKCIRENAAVTVIVRPGSRRRKLLDKFSAIEIIEAGLSDLAELARTNAGNCGIEYSADSLCAVQSDLKPADSSIGESIFYHLAWDGTVGAARNDVSLQDDNVRYALDAVRLAAALGCTTFVIAGSQAEYGRCDEKLTPDTPCHPENEYGRAKLEAGNKCSALCRELGLKFIRTRILSVYGPYDGDGSMISATIDKLLKGQEAPLSKGEQLWDYLYSADAADMLYLLGECGKDAHTYLVASGNSRALREYIDEICDTIRDMSGEYDFAPGNPAIGLIPYSNSQVMHLAADISQTVKDTGYTPDTPFREGIRTTAEHRLKNAAANCGGQRPGC